MTRYRKEWISVLFLAVAVAVSFQGSRGLYETSEGRYAECAREMLESGNYLEPTLGYKPHWTKPPITYWAIVAGMKLIGENEWGVRLYNIIAFALTVLCVTAIGKTLFDSTTGIVAGCIYATSPFPALAAYAVTTDTLLTLWTTLAIFCFTKHLKSAENNNRAQLWANAMWASFGMGFATKGPPALLLLLPILVWRYRERCNVRMMTLRGLLVFALLGLSWYGVVAMRHAGLLAYFLSTEVAARIASKHVHNHAWYKGFGIYLPVLIFGAGWWLYPVFRGMRRRNLWRPSQILFYVKQDTRYALLLLLVTVPLCILMVASSKLQLYALPLFAPLSILLARTFAGASSVHCVNRRTWRMACTGCVILICIKGLAANVDPKANIKSAARLCGRHATCNAEFVAVESSRLYGLQYYLGGHLTRVSITGKEPWADMSLRVMITRIEDADTDAEYVLIAKRNFVESLIRILKSRGLDFSMEEEHNQTLFIIAGHGAAVQPQRTDDA